MDRFTVYINGEFCWIGIGSPDINITDKLKKGKNVIAICYYNAFHTKAHPHEGPVQKLSGLFYPVSITGKTEKGNYLNKIKKWKIKGGLSGDSKGYSGNLFDDRKWQHAPASNKYVIQEEVGNIIWFRRKFRYSKDKNWIAPLYLKIPELKDRCLIYLNGKRIGMYEGIGPQEKFYLPESYLKDENQITLLIEGPGFHPVKQFGFIPPYFKELELDYFYRSKKVKIEVTYKRKKIS